MSNDRRGRELIHSRHSSSLFIPHCSRMRHLHARLQHCSYSLASHTLPQTQRAAPNHPNHLHTLHIRPCFLGRDRKLQNSTLHRSSRRYLRVSCNLCALSPLCSICSTQWYVWRGHVPSDVQRSQRHNHKGKRDMAKNELGDGIPISPIISAVHNCDGSHAGNGQLLRQFLETKVRPLLGAGYQDYWPHRLRDGHFPLLQARKAYNEITPRCNKAFRFQGHRLFAIYPIGESRKHRLQKFSRFD